MIVGSRCRTRREVGFGRVGFVIWFVVRRLIRRSEDECTSALVLMLLVLCNVCVVWFTVGSAVSGPVIGSIGGVTGGSVASLVSVLVLGMRNVADAVVNVPFGAAMAPV